MVTNQKQPIYNDNSMLFHKHTPLGIIPLVHCHRHMEFLERLETNYFSLIAHLADDLASLAWSNLSKECHKQVLSHRGVKIPNVPKNVQTFLTYCISALSVINLFSFNYMSRYTSLLKRLGKSALIYKIYIKYSL